MLKLTYFCLNLKVFLKSNYIEKLNVETQNSLQKKGLIPWSLLRLSAVWYDVGYDIQSLYMALCFEILIIFGDLGLAKFVFFIVAMFFLILIL